MKTRLAPVNDDTSAAARTGHGVRQNVWVTIRVTGHDRQVPVCVGGATVCRNVCAEPRSTLGNSRDCVIDRSSRVSGGPRLLLAGTA